MTAGVCEWGGPGLIVVQPSPSSLLQSRHRTQRRCTRSAAYSGSTTRRCAASAPAKAEGKALRQLCLALHHLRVLSWSTGGETKDKDVAHALGTHQGQKSKHRGQEPIFQTAREKTPTAQRGMRRESRGGKGQ